MEQRTKRGHRTALGVNWLQTVDWETRSLKNIIFTETEIQREELNTKGKKHRIYWTERTVKALFWYLIVIMSRPGLCQFMCPLSSRITACCNSFKCNNKSGSRSGGFTVENETQHYWFFTENLATLSKQCHVVCCELQHLNIYIIFITISWFSDPCFMDLFLTQRCSLVLYIMWKG